MKKYDYIIGIDPDSDKSGFTWIDTKEKQIQVKSLAFPELIEKLTVGRGSIPNTIVLVEAGWLNQSNWHTNKSQSHRVAAAIGNKTGRNHEVGRKIIEMCKFHGIEVQEVRPLKKCWKGKDGKISQEEISYFIPGFPKRSNQEERDSALLAWYFAGLPIKVKPIYINS